ncbi:MAG: hypothetical protein CYPHOPRED_002934 [Cyphobasidiales sp. Tagirdzhanova-0007]|nr:MAG: hypothetical protein CYPHOPRED_002934 [Cyphobasidiales sp. Tagirdzhanova-0007]
MKQATQETALKQGMIYDDGRKHEKWEELLKEVARIANKGSLSKTDIDEANNGLKCLCAWAIKDFDEANHRMLRDKKYLERLSLLKKRMDKLKEIANKKSQELGPEMRKHISSHIISLFRGHTIPIEYASKPHPEIESLWRGLGIDSKKVEPQDVSKLQLMTGDKIMKMLEEEKLSSRDIAMLTGREIFSGSRLTVHWDRLLTVIKKIVVESPSDNLMREKGISCLLDWASADYSKALPGTTYLERLKLLEKRINLLKNYTREYTIRKHGTLQPYDKMKTLQQDIDTRVDVIFQHLDIPVHKYTKEEKEEILQLWSKLRINKINDVYELQKRTGIHGKRYSIHP